MRNDTAQRVATVLASCAVVSLLFFAYFVAVAKPNERRLLDVEACVSQQWRAFEDVRSQMPSIEIERQWRRECVASLRSAS